MKIPPQMIGCQDFKVPRLYGDPREKGWHMRKGFTHACETTSAAARYTYVHDEPALLMTTHDLVEMACEAARDLCRCVTAERINATAGNQISPFRT